MTTNKRKTTKKTSTKATAKAKSMQYADGKATDNRKGLAKTVEELMGVTSRDPFRVASGESFQEAVTSMSLSQLQEIAVNAGVFPSGTKATLKNKLLKEYENRTHGRYGASTNSKPIVDPNSEKARDILRIINE